MEWRPSTVAGHWATGPLGASVCIDSTSGGLHQSCTSHAGANAHSSSLPSRQRRRRCRWRRLLFRGSIVFIKLHAPRSTSHPSRPRPRLRPRTAKRVKEERPVQLIRHHTLRIRTYLATLHHLEPCTLHLAACTNGTLPVLHRASPPSSRLCFLLFLEAHWSRSREASAVHVLHAPRLTPDAPTPSRLTPPRSRDLRLRLEPRRQTP